MNKRKYHKRKRRILYGRVFVVLLVLGIIVSGILFVIKQIGQGNTDREAKEKIEKIKENSKEYPKELLELLEHNKETADFVYDYPKKKNNKPAKTIGKISSGKIPELLQWDERWGYAEYVDNMIAINGCGPTALSMVAAGLTGDNRITPYKVAKYAGKNGYYVEGTGTAWSLMTEASRHFGVRGREISLDENVVVAELASGHPIICSVGPGDFTSSGHFIVLAGIEEGKIKVNDPNSRERSRRWDYDRLSGQINNLWAFDKNF